MILTGNEIQRQVELGAISISDFKASRLNPNSYNLRLAPELAMCDDHYLDFRRKPTMRTFEIGRSGHTLHPGVLYLARTVERTATRNFVPMIEGRSSVGRLGLFVHVSAGFGDVGFDGYWTLELHCVQPIRIYPFVEICQIYYHTFEGEPTFYADDAKYNHNGGVQASKLCEEFEGAKFDENLKEYVKLG